MTLKAKLLITILGLVALALVVLDIVAVKTLQSYLYHQTDEQLDAARGPVARRVVPPAAGSTTTIVLPPPPVSSAAPETSRPALISDYFIQLRNADGSVETQLTPTVRGDEDPVPNLTQATISQNVGKSPFTVGSIGNDGFKYRVIANYSTNGQVIVAALPLNTADNTIEQLVKTELLVTSAVLLALCIAAWWILRVELRQLTAITNTACAISEGDLSQRVPSANPKTEIGQLSDAFNLMLSQIEASFIEKEASEERLRRFATDASHELRTPLTAVRGYAELYRQGAVKDDEHLARIMTRIESEASRMGLLVDDLLTLARLDQRRPFEFKEVNVVSTVNDVVEDSRVIDPSRRITFSSETNILTVQGDAPRLHQVFSNLVGNAMAHTPPGTDVTVKISSTETEAVIEVADDGPGMSTEAIDHAFERFYRADAGRTRVMGTQGGTGLGLSIVKSIVDTHKGQVSISSPPGKGATFQVRLPRVSA